MVLLSTEAPMITTLPERIAALPEPMRAACGRLYAVDRVEGRAVPPHEMEEWIARSFGSIEAVRRQQIVRVTNRLTLEAALFNPLRARRPSGESATDAELASWIDEELKESDFADPLRRTPADTFGRISGRFCVSASNIAKYDGWHGLVVFGRGNPLLTSSEELADYFDVALRWIAAAHAADPLALYPMITWNCLPKSGATIVHGHMQVALGRAMHYARPELWRRAAQVYITGNGSPALGGYFDDLFAVHAGLGLALRDEPGLRSFVHLTPMRNREVVILADAAALRERAGGSASGLADLGGHLAGALYPVLRAMIDAGVRAFNMGVALPPLAHTPERWEGFPAIARIGDRGPALTSRNDWGAMELFASGCITADPFEVAEQLTR
jgi:hypothetical protein